MLSSGAAAFDVSGDATEPRDNEKRLALYVGQPVEVRRIAHNMDQVSPSQPPSLFSAPASS